MSNTYSIVYERRVAKDLSRIPRQQMEHIFTKIEQLASGEDMNLDIKKLKGFEDVYRLRVGEHRVMYKKDGEAYTIYIIQVGHRKDVYM